MCEGSQKFECEKCQVFLALVCAVAISIVIVQLSSITRGIVASAIAIAVVSAAALLLWVDFKGLKWTGRTDRAKALVLVLVLCIASLAISAMSLEPLLKEPTHGTLAAVLATSTFFVSGIASLGAGAVAASVLASLFPAAP